MPSCASVVLGLLAPLVIASPASADKISDMRKQAARMADHLDDLEERADNLSEDYAEAVYELAAARRPGRRRHRRRWTPPTRRSARPAAASAATR